MEGMATRTIKRHPDVEKAAAELPPVRHSRRLARFRYEAAPAWPAALRASAASAAIMEFFQRGRVERDVAMAALELCVADLEDGAVENEGLLSWQDEEVFAQRLRRLQAVIDEW